MSSSSSSSSPASSSSESGELISITAMRREVSGAPARLRVAAQLATLSTRTTRTNSSFLELKLADAETTLSLKVWGDAPEFGSASALKPGQFYEFAGAWRHNAEYKSHDLSDWKARPLSEQETATLLAGSPELKARQEADYAFIISAARDLADPRLQALAGLFLERHGERLRRTAAARDFHHARRGGLVEHVAQMMRSAIKICEAYPMLNRDLLVAGVLFHDCGKLWENAYEARGFKMPFSEVSELLSHIPFGVELVNRLWHQVMESPESAAWLTLEPANDAVRLHLLHLILAHHGEMQFGSPVVPKTPEAVALHYIDNLDAKLEMFALGYQTSEELARNVQERVRPLPGRLVRPLPHFLAPVPTEPMSVVHEEPEWARESPIPATEPEAAPEAGEEEEPF